MDREERKKNNKDEKIKGKDRKKKKKKLYISEKKILIKNSLARSNSISMQGGNENKWID